MSAYDAVKALELDIANDAEIILFDPNGPNTFDPVINEAVCAVIVNDAVFVNELDIALEEDIANEALVAYDAVTAFCDQEAVAICFPCIKFTAIIN